MIAPCSASYRVHASPEISGLRLRWYGAILASGLPGVSSIKGGCEPPSYLLGHPHQRLTPSLFSEHRHEIHRIQREDPPAGDGGFLLN